MRFLINIDKHVIFGNIIDDEFRFHNGYYRGTDEDGTHWCTFNRCKKAVKYPCKIVIPYKYFNHYNPESSFKYKI